MRENGVIFSKGLNVLVHWASWVLTYKYYYYIIITLLLRVSRDYVYIQV